tara:strand:- start:8 stop:757 length:750 start_codon:yes stop_codon:yes gene_type:complete
MKISSQQITSRGIAQQSGLDTLSSIINYTGEYINYTTGLDPALAIASAYSTTADDPFVDSLLNNPPSVINAWYKFYTGGSPWATTTTPLALGQWGAFLFYGNNTASLLQSYGGIYQKLSLIEGDNYNIYIDRYGFFPETDSTQGIIEASVYTPQDESYVKIFENQVNVTMGASDSQTFDIGEFTAASANDIILIAFTSPYIGSSSAGIRKISIKRKEEYLIPVYATDMWGNAHKVLRVAADQIIPTDET